MAPLVIWTTGLAVSAAGLWSTRFAVRDRMPPQLAIHQQRSGPSPVQPVSDSSPDSAWLSAPFRASRTAAPHAYTPAAAAAEAAAADSARVVAAAAQAAADSAAALQQARPDWTLTGTILGSPPTAIFDGVSGHGSASEVLAVGEEVGGFKVSEVYADSVIVIQGNREWTFKVALPWS